MRTITLTGNPLSTNHIYRRGAGNRLYMSEDATLRKLEYVSEVREQWGWNPPLTGPIAVRIALYFGDRRRRDLDNYHKISLDALSEIVYEDDSQIQEMAVSKHIDTGNPRIEITINNI